MRCVSDISICSGLKAAQHSRNNCSTCCRVLRKEGVHRLYYRVKVVLTAETYTVTVLLNRSKCISSGDDIADIQVTEY